MDSHLLTSFKCKQRGTSGVLMEHLLDYDQGTGIFRLNNVQFKIDLKDVTTISGLNIVSQVFRPHPGNNEQALEN